MGGDDVSLSGTMFVLIVILVLSARYLKCSGCANRLFYQRPLKRLYLMELHVATTVSDI